MKIGILTYHRAHNHGALLQAYALKHYLELNGYDVEIIDYWPKYHSSVFQIIPSFSSISFAGKIRAIIKLIIGLRRNYKRRAGYVSFMKNYLNLPKRIKYSTIESLKELNYDIIVYGSDQIWRKQKTELCKGIDTVYWGEFVQSKRKIAYAASAGIVNYNLDDNNQVKRLLNDFYKIAVRENDLQNYIEDHCKVEASLVLDPVFLLNKTQWCSIVPEKRLVKEKYIFFYQLLLSDESEAYVKQLKEKTGYRVIEIQGRFNPFKIGAQYNFQTASTLDFIRLIRDAEYIVSTSFHGVALSILLEKNFYALGMSNNSERVRTLLKSLKIENRIVQDSNMIVDDLDYNQISANLLDVKKKSQEFLINAINL